MVEIMIVVAVVGLLGALAVPNLVLARKTSQTNACINNLREIDQAKQQWALENGKQATDTPGAVALQVYLGRGTAGSVSNVVCPLAPTAYLGASGGYSINAVGVPPTCPQANSTNHNAVLN